MDYISNLLSLNTQIGLYGAIAHSCNAVFTYKSAFQRQPQSYQLPVEVVTCASQDPFIKMFIRRLLITTKFY